MLKNRLSLLSILIFYFCNTSKVNAAHIIGGDMTYKCVEVDSINKTTTFNIVVIMYRDSKGGGAQFDDPARFGVFRGNGMNWTFLQQIREEPKELENLTFVEDPCITIPPNVGVQSGRYEFMVTLDWSNETYKIAYQRCCRNNTISNLVNPQSTGAVFEIDITPEAQTSCNNSPTFNSFPPIVLCANTPVDLDLSVSDTEGHQVFYEFCAPKSSGGQNPGQGCDAIIPTPMNCLPPYGTATFLLPNYSISNPLGASANMVLDPVTGRLTLTPKLVGQFVVGICVKEFKNGKILSEITRDFQFNVAECEDLVKAVINTTAPGTTIDNEFDLLTIKSCFNTKLKFDNSSTSVMGDPTFLWEFDILGGKIQDTARNAVINFPYIGTFIGRMIINPDNGVCSDTANIKVIIYPELIGAFEYDYDTCIAGPIAFFDRSTSGGNAVVDSWKWKFSQKDSSITQNPIFSYRDPGYKSVELIIEDTNACLDTVVEEIRWIPVPDILLIEPSDFVGCVPASIFFNNLSFPIDSTYQIQWNFGDSEVDSVISPSHIYLDTGIFDVRLEVISPEGCFVFRDYPKLIEISPAPIADFDFSPTSSSNLDSEVFFTNESQNIEGWEWNFGLEGLSFSENPTYSFQDTGIYLVKMIGYNPLGCSDTIIKTIDIIPIATLHTPNAFTPNNDGLNDEFIPKGIFLGIKDYSFTVWDRWGGKIFESNDLTIGWNGEFMNSGKQSPSGVYVYQISYTEPRGKKIHLNGQFSLIR